MYDECVYDECVYDECVYDECVYGQIYLIHAYVGQDVHGEEPLECVLY